MAKTSDEAVIPLGDNSAAPDVFADGCVGAFLNNGNVHMTFTSRRCDYSQQPNIFSDMVIGRLVMPFAAAENMASFLTKFVEQMKKQAASPPVDAPRTIQ
jgi:hypothetical protein